jgi:transcriptional regulator with XRE-family HTH domain
MLIGDRLKELREAKHLSQGEVENRTALKRCYISRVENGHTVPAVETLEKFARALEVPLYAVFYDSETSPTAAMSAPVDKDAFGVSGRERRYIEKLRQFLSRMKARDRELLMHIVRQLSAASIEASFGRFVSERFRLVKRSPNDWQKPSLREFTMPRTHLI